METQTEEKTKSLGHVDSLHLDITEPIKMNDKITYNKINLFTGQNGVGKSFLNSMVFAITNIASFEIVTGKASPEVVDEIFSKCFDSKIVGNIVIMFDSGAEVHIELDDKGRCLTARFVGLKGLEPVKPMYLSTNFRTFNNISTYLFARKFIPGDAANKMEEMSKQFKLFDVTLIESFIMNCPKEFESDQVESLCKMTGDDGVFKDLKGVNVDLESCDFILSFNDGSTKKATQFGNGHQSAFCMFLALNI